MNELNGIARTLLEIWNMSLMASGAVGDEMSDYRGRQG